LGKTLKGMSRSNLEYGAIIDADDDNEGDLVFTIACRILTIYRDKLILNSMARSKPMNQTNSVDFTAQEDLGKPQRKSPPFLH
jgi:hypothetical protein